GNKPLRMIQISDIHLFADRERALLGVKTQQSFDAVVNEVRAKEQGKLDAIILSGDLSQDGTAASYQYFLQQLAPCKVPIYAFPGNHDTAATLKQAYQGSIIACPSQLLFPHWQVILLDSQRKDAVEGEL